MAAMEKVIDEAGFVLGPHLEAFEQKMSQFCGCSYGAGVASGTEALHLALLASGIKPGDEVVTTPFSFIATAEAISYVGARPVFVDIDEKTFNINPDLIEEHLSPKTKAIVPVHLYGQPVDMDKIKKIAQKYSLKIIEDCAQAIGARYFNQPVGSFGDAGCFSFFPTKNLGAFGDGGMVVTSNPEIARLVKMLRGHGGLERDVYQILGFNSRLDILQVAILEAKLKYLEAWTASRRHHAYYYNQLLQDLPLETPFELPNTFCVYNQYTIKVKERPALIDYLKKEGIGIMVYYPRGMHQQKIYQDVVVNLPVVEKIQGQVLSLPIYPELTDSLIELVAQTIRRFYRQ